jgi:hypothetical protein
MSNRVFIAVIALVFIGFGAAFVLSPKQKIDNTLVGVAEHKNQGVNHIPYGTQHEVYNSELPSSGSHYNDASAPALWGIYTQELPPEVFLHNLEHGGVVIAYSPNLPPLQIKNLRKLFGNPSSDRSFSAGKYILIPRSANKQPIELASWTRTYSLTSYDQSKIEKFYNNNVGNKRAPESFAGPKNLPINQAL